MLSYLVYISSAVQPISEQDLVELLKVSRINNDRDAITGMLLHKDGNFMQVMEGPEESVTGLMSKIQADRRHKNIITLLNGPLETRQFGSWLMGFQNVDLLSDSEREGASTFLQDDFTERAFGNDPHKALKLLLSFKRNMR